MKTYPGVISVLTIILGLALTALTGCATKQVEYTGFLGDYPAFKPGPKDGADLVYIKEGADFRAYDKIMLDRVVIYLSEDQKYEGIHPGEVIRLANAFHKSMAAALADSYPMPAYPMVDEPGPGVLRIRVAITEVVASKPKLNAITTIIPIGLAISTVKKGFTGTHTFVGGASLEAEFLDSQTNEQLAAVIDTKAAEKYKIKEGMSEWGHAKDTFEFWAKRLRLFLDTPHEKK